MAQPLIEKAAVTQALRSMWYKDAVIYQLHVRAFCDSNNDGIGDFPGLTQKLDYLQDLGIDAIWLMPFFPSPLRDDGYDISDYYSVHPELRRVWKISKLFWLPRTRVESALSSNSS